MHLCRISSAEGVALVRAAKQEGLAVTADVSINSLHLSDHDMGYFDSRARLTPVLRKQRDRDALQAALADGTLDVLVSDHTPVDNDAKALPFAQAEPGATGAELLLPLTDILTPNSLEARRLAQELGQAGEPDRKSVV